MDVLQFFSEPTPVRRSTTLDGTTPQRVHPDGVDESSIMRDVIMMSPDGGVGPVGTPSTTAAAERRGSSPVRIYYGGAAPFVVADTATISTSSPLPSAESTANVHQAPRGGVGVSLARLRQPPNHRERTLKSSAAGDLLEALVQSGSGLETRRTLPHARHPMHTDAAADAQRREHIGGPAPTSVPAVGGTQPHHSVWATHSPVDDGQRRHGDSMFAGDRGVVSVKWACFSCPLNDELLLDAASPIIVFCPQCGARQP